MPRDSQQRARLPVELFEQIISLLHDNDLPSLENCSRASSILSVLCQKYIFHEVLFTQRSSLDVTGDTFRKFFDLLHHSPHIASYIQSIVIDTAFLAVSSRNQYLKRTLPLLKSLRKVGLSKLNVRADSFWWYFMDAETRDALLDVFKSSHITDIDLTGIRDFPPEKCFSFSPSLKRLSLPTLVFNRSTIDPLVHLTDSPHPLSSITLTPRWPPKLEALAIVDVFDDGLTLSWLASPVSVSPVDLSQLRSLKLDFEEVTSTNNQDSSKLDLALKHFSHSLTDIHLNVLQRNMPYYLWSETQGWSSLPRSSIPPPSFNIVPTLEKMTINSRIFQHPRDSDFPLSYRSPLSWIAWLLTRSSDVMLKTLVVNISFCGITQGILRDLDWSKLTIALTASVLWKGTTVILRFSDIEPLGMDALNSNDRFVELASKGVIISYQS